MADPQNLETLHEWVSAHRAHDRDRLLACLTDDIVIRSAAGQAMPPANGKAEAWEHWKTIYDTFPDMRIDLLDVTADGDRLVAEISHGGTMKGEMVDRAPTGKSYRVTGAFRMDFQNGKIRRIQTYWDTGSMMEQLGLGPA